MKWKYGPHPIYLEQPLPWSIKEFLRESPSCRMHEKDTFPTTWLIFVSSGISRVSALVIMLASPASSCARPSFLAGSASLTMPRTDLAALFRWTSQGVKSVKSREEA